MNRLLPKALDSHVIQRIIYFHRKFSRIPIGAISIGSFLHSDLCSNPKLPFVGPTRTGFLRKFSSWCHERRQLMFPSRIWWDNQRYFGESRQTEATLRRAFAIESSVPEAKARRYGGSQRIFEVHWSAKCDFRRSGRRIEESQRWERSFVQLNYR